MVVYVVTETSYNEEKEIVKSDGIGVYTKEKNARIAFNEMKEFFLNDGSKEINVNIENDMRYEIEDNAYFYDEYDETINEVALWCVETYEYDDEE